MASVNLFEALDDVEAQQKRRHAKWYANKVVEKSLVAMRAALKTARGMAVLQAEARYVQCLFATNADASFLCTHRPVWLC